MAQYWEDFTADTVGAAPTRWLDIGGAVSPTSRAVIASDAAAPAGKKLAFVQDSSTRRGIKFTPVDADAGRETLSIRALIRPVNYPNNGALFGLLGRGFGTTSTTLGGTAAEVQRVNSTTHEIRLADRNVTVQTVLGTGAGNPVPTGTAQWWHLTINGTTATLTLAPANNPTSETAVASGTTSYTADGWVGFILLLSGTSFDLLAFGVGTGGDAAPYQSPSLGSSGSVAVTDAGDAVAVTGAAPAIGAVAVSDAGDVVAATGLAPAAVAVTDAQDVVGVAAGVGGTGVRLRPSIKVERGAVDAGRTGLRWAVFSDADLADLVDSGTGISLDSEGRPTIDLIGSGLDVGDWVYLHLTHFNSALPPWNRVVRSFGGFVQAEAIP